MAPAANPENDHGVPVDDDASELAYITELENKIREMLNGADASHPDAVRDH